MLTVAQPSPACWGDRGKTRLQTRFELPNQGQEEEARAGPHRWTAMFHAPADTQWDNQCVGVKKNVIVPLVSLLSFVKRI